MKIEQLLTAADPEPGVGTVVRDSCGGVWLNTGYYPCAWMHPGGRGGAWDEVETWTKIAGNYGPVVVLSGGDA